MLIARCFFFLLGCVAFTVGISPVPWEAPHYHVVKQIVLERGSVAYLGLDAVRRRLYGADTVVIDVDSNKIIGTLPPGTGHGFALAPDLNRGLGRRGVIFDLSTLALLGHVSAQGETGTYDQATHRAFLVGKDTITAVDMKSATVVGRASLRHGLPGNVTSAVSDGQGHVFVNVLTFPNQEVAEAAQGGSDQALRSGTTEVRVLDANTLAVIRHIPIDSCGGMPSALAMDRAHARLFVNCPGKLIVLSSTSGQPVAIVPVQGWAKAMAFDSIAGLVFSPTQGYLTIVHEDSPDTFKVIDTLSTVDGGSVVAVDDRTHRAFVVGSDGPPHVIVLAPEKE